MPVYQQVADLTVGSNAALIAAELQIGVIGGVCQFGGRVAALACEELAVVIQIVLKLGADAVLDPGSGCCCGGRTDTCQGIVAVAVGHEVGRIPELHIRMDRAGQESGEVGIPFHGDAHPVGHFVADGEGQGHIRDLGIDRCFAGDAAGETGDAHGGIHIRPEQLLHGNGGTGEDRVMVVIGQSLETLAGSGRQNVKAGELNIATRIPVHLQSQFRGLVPVVFGGFCQFLDGVTGDFQTHIVGQITCVVVQAPENGVQHIDTGNHRQHPACPLNGILFQNDHQHQRCQDHNTQHHNQQLPQRERHNGRPLGQKSLECADDVRVDHIHQSGKFFTELHQHPGDGTEDGGSQVTEPIFQRKVLLLSLLMDFTSITHLPGIVCI